ncbi:MAG: sugar ABC transporter permease [Clostridia bacterium]|nr:sugar ABC transporter permease [Clostridia bacterium]
MRVQSGVHKLKKTRWEKFTTSCYQNKYLYLLALPGFIWLVLFAYKPMLGVLMAFQDYNIIGGLWDSPWVGFKHFQTFFSGKDFAPIMGNTIKISLLQLLFGFPMPIILAIIFNELRTGAYKKVTQTISYLPHFLSWITIAGMMTTILSPSTGLVNNVLVMFGIEPIYFLAEKSMFVPILIISSIWKEIGWSSVIYLASLAGLDQEVGEAATIDGCTRFQKIIYINFPYLMSTVAIMLILRVGGILNAGFDQIFNLYSPATYDVADVLDTYVYRLGISGFQYSLSTAIGLFKSVVGVIMVVVTNWLTKRLSDGEVSL